MCNYTRRIAVYNLTITDLVNKDEFFYTCDQFTAKYPNQIGSYVYFHVKEYLNFFYFELA